METLKLYSYFRSSAAFRVRIALELKQLNYTIVPVHLVRKGGEQNLDTYRFLNPQKLVPTLVHNDLVITQSMAIIEYLDECFPDQRLLPETPKLRAQCRSLSQIVCCDIHPINNLRVLNYLRNEFSQHDRLVRDWMQRWIDEGFSAVEALIKNSNTTCIPEAPYSMADICLVPQVFNAQRFELDMAPYPNILSIFEHCMSHPAFIKAAPENQPDCE